MNQLELLQLLFIIVLIHENTAKFPMQFIFANDTNAGDTFGCSVAIHSNLAIIGTEYNAGNGDGSGAAYIFQHDAQHNIWRQSAKLIPDDGNNEDSFGSAVAIHDNSVLIGAERHYYNGIRSGSAYIFSRNSSNGSWYQQTILSPDDGANADYFGHAVSIYGNYIIIGSYMNDEYGAGSGAAYIFEYNEITGSWEQQIKLKSNDISATHRFGAHLNSNIYNGGYSGSAYIFSRDPVTNEWSQSQKLLPDDATTGDKFGYAVSIDTDYAIIGAWRDDEYGVNAGSAYIYERNEALNIWTQNTKLAPDDIIIWSQQIAEMRFGSAVSINENYALVTAPQDDDNAIDSGSVYLFQRDEVHNSWNQITKILSVNAAESDAFGGAVSFSYPYGVIGAPLHDTNGIDSGAAYIIDLSGAIKPAHPSRSPLLNGQTLDPTLEPTVNPALPPTMHPTPSPTIINSQHSMQQILTGDTFEGGRLGRSVAINTNFAIIAADVDFDIVGAAYVVKYDYTDDIWRLSTKLVPDDGEILDQFGCAVAMYGEYAVIGAEYSSNNGIRQVNVKCS